MARYYSIEGKYIRADAIVAVVPKHAMGPGAQVLSMTLYLEGGASIEVHSSHACQAIRKLFEGPSVAVTSLDEPSSPGTPPASS